LPRILSLAEPMLPVISALGSGIFGWVLAAVLTADVIAASYFVPDPPMKAMANNPATNSEASPAFAHIQRLC
jgi:hypothetical protein